MECFRALGALCEPPEPGHEHIAEALELRGRASTSDYADLFLFQLYPYASVYLGHEGMLGGEARDRVAGFWRALRLLPPAEPDHLAALLGLYTTLAEAEAAETDSARRALWRESRRALLWEHLLSWLPPYLAKLEEIASPFYRGWAALLRETLRAEARVLGQQPLLPLHLRDAAPLEPPEEAGGQALLDGLLAPVRSGMILVRDDLARAARELGLSLRVAERRFVLRALIEQDAPATLAWLADEASAWRARHEAERPLAGPIASFWASRADETGRVLAAAATAARDEGTRVSRTACR